MALTDTSDAVAPRVTQVEVPAPAEDGLTAVGSRPQPGLPARLVYARSFEDESIWRRWSPDGQQITFASDLEGQFELNVIPAGGGKPRRRRAGTLRGSRSPR